MLKTTIIAITDDDGFKFGFEEFENLRLLFAQFLFGKPIGCGATVGFDGVGEYVEDEAVYGECTAGFDEGTKGWGTVEFAAFGYKL